METTRGLKFTKDNLREGVAEQHAQRTTQNSAHHNNTTKTPMTDIAILVHESTKTTQSTSIPP